MQWDVPEVHLLLNDTLDERLQCAIECLALDRNFGRRYETKRALPPRCFGRKC